MLISLGSDCHSAYWLKGEKLTNESFPFDWLLTRAFIGLEYVADVVEADFAGFCLDINANLRGHPVAARFPTTELFHHRDLLSADLAIKKTEEKKLERRAARFRAQAALENDFIYCYPMDARNSKPESLARFDHSVDRVLKLWPQSRLHVYYLDNEQTGRSPDVLVARHRLHQYTYFRDQLISKTWGAAPTFFAQVAKSAGKLL